MSKPMTPDEFIEKWMSRRETDINLDAMRADLEEMLEAERLRSNGKIKVEIGRYKGTIKK